VKAAHPDCRLPRIRIRTGRCYELAFRGASRAPRWSVVHGHIVCDGVRIAHAWLLNGGEVFCPTYDRTFGEAEYLAIHGGVPTVTYTLLEANRLLCLHGHYGPWHKS
jgi:hypothetical protein